VPIYRRRDRFDDSFTNAFVSCKRTHFFFIFLRESECREQILLFIYMVGLDNGRKYGETILGVKSSVKIVSIDTSNFLGECLEDKG
jgi:hypothetical protein